MIDALTRFVGQIFFPADNGTASPYHPAPLRTPAKRMPVLLTRSSEVPEGPGRRQFCQARADSKLRHTAIGNDPC